VAAAIKVAREFADTNGTDDIVIGVVDPEISKIGNPGDIETTGESAGDDEPCVRRGTGEYDIGLPLLDQPLASRKRGLDPIAPHIGHVDQAEIMPPKDGPER